MRDKITSQGEGFAIPPLFSKASRLVFSGTQLWPSPKCFLPVSVYHCMNTDSIADD